MIRERSSRCSHECRVSGDFLSGSDGLEPATNVIAKRLGAFEAEMEQATAADANLTNAPDGTNTHSRFRNDA